MCLDCEIEYIWKYELGSFTIVSNWWKQSNSIWENWKHMNTIDEKRNKSAFLVFRKGTALKFVTSPSNSAKPFPSTILYSIGIFRRY